MPRLLFEKTGNAIWISHLDLMRLFQRAFKRAGLPLTHTQGYNPRPSVSIALPLSVGVESVCELLDFDLDGADYSCEEMMQRLNHALVEGVRVVKVYDDAKKIKHLAYLDCEVCLEYDAGVPDDAAEKIRTLFAQHEILVEKKGKNGIAVQDIKPMIRKFFIAQTDGNTLLIAARVCCQNPTLNPLQISVAVEKYLPECKPDFAKCRRIEIYDTNETVFR